MKISDGDQVSCRQDEIGRIIGVSARMLCFFVFFFVYFFKYKILFFCLFFLWQEFVLFIYSVWHVVNPWLKTS